MKEFFARKINPFCFKGQTYTVTYEGPCVRFENSDCTVHEEVHWMTKPEFDLRLSLGDFDFNNPVDPTDFVIALELGQWVAMSDRYNTSGSGETPNEALLALEQQIRRMK